jgi:predicted HicB family RNase H-like nuclease
MNSMTYQGYTARIEFDERDGIFWGKVLGINDSITFEGETVVQLTQDFHNAIDFYLADCAAIGKDPQKSASGKLMLRIPPELHAAALVKARSVGKSLNQWAIDALRHEVGV